jgi:hypothetical protein
MEYHSYIGKETLFREYKSFSFQHISLPFDEDDVCEYLQTFQWNFNHLVEKSLEKYARIYLPKYMTAFFDHHTPTDEDGQLFFGVNDWGITTGIPYQGVLTKQHILSPAILSYLATHVCSSEPLSSLLERIQIDIVPVTYGERVLPATHPDVTEYKEKKRILETKLKQHSQKYTEWRLQNELYSRKLVDLYKIPKCRSNFITYLRKHRQYRIISKIKNGVAIEQQKYDKIREFRETGDNLYAWLCQWKDEMLNKIRNEKPMREKSYKNITTSVQSIYKPFHIFMKMEDLIPWWMQHNPNMNLYVVNITFKKKGQPPVKDIHFIDYLQKQIKCFRGLTPSKLSPDCDEPCCIPY